MLKKKRKKYKIVTSVESALLLLNRYLGYHTKSFLFPLFSVGSTLRSRGFKSRPVPPFCERKKFRSTRKKLSPPRARKTRAALVRAALEHVVWPSLRTTAGSRRAKVEVREHHLLRSRVLRIPRTPYTRFIARARGLRADGSFLLRLIKRQ